MRAAAGAPPCVAEGAHLRRVLQAGSPSPVPATASPAPPRSTQKAGLEGKLGNDFKGTVLMPDNAAIAVRVAGQRGAAPAGTERRNVCAGGVRLVGLEREHCLPPLFKVHAAGATAPPSSDASSPYASHPSPTLQEFHALLSSFGRGDESLETIDPKVLAMILSDHVSPDAVSQPMKDGQVGPAARR